MVSNGSAASVRYALGGVSPAIRRLTIKPWGFWSRLGCVAVYSVQPVHRHRKTWPRYGRDCCPGCSADRAALPIRHLPLPGEPRMQAGHDSSVVVLNELPFGPACTATARPAMCLPACAAMGEGVGQPRSTGAATTGLPSTGLAISASTVVAASVFSCAIARMAQANLYAPSCADCACPLHQPAQLATVYGLNAVHQTKLNGHPGKRADAIAVVPGTLQRVSPLGRKCSSSIALRAIIARLRCGVCDRWLCGASSACIKEYLKCLSGLGAKTSAGSAEMSGMVVSGSAKMSVLSADLSGG